MAFYLSTNFNLMIKRRFLMFLTSMMMVIVGFSQNTNNLKFAVTEYAFGKIPQNKPVTYSFNFQNTGTKQVIIENAVAECGCTKPIFPEQPIMKDKFAKITVTYDAKDIGSFTKKITVSIVNSKEPIILTITGEVVKEK